MDNPAQKDFGDYNSTRLVREIMDDSKDSPRIFVINLPEADTARTFCAEIINRVFRYRKNSFTLQPKIAFVFDEAQEFIPYDKKKEDGTEYSSRAVEKLLRHGRNTTYMDGYLLKGLLISIQMHFSSCIVIL